MGRSSGTVVLKQHKQDIDKVNYPHALHQRSGLDTLTIPQVQPTSRATAREPMPYRTTAQSGAAGVQPSKNGTSFPAPLDPHPIL
ncbi:MAG: hypothetical protein L3J67_07560 [Hyphomicrobiaceae bacterium]|nr:hypothetical protein [Hyphomicrobiaceae bacterium]